MTYPYHLAVHGVFFEAAKDGGVAIIRKAESRLTSRTLVRVDLTAAEWAEAIAAMKKIHNEVKGYRVVEGVEVKVQPSTLGPISEQGSAPDTLPAAGPPPILPPGYQGKTTSKAAAIKGAASRAEVAGSKLKIDRVAIAQDKK